MARTSSASGTRVRRKMCDVWMDLLGFSYVVDVMDEVIVVCGGMKRLICVWVKKIERCGAEAASDIARNVREL